MPLDAVVGVNWGDEGKGRIVDYLAPRAKAVVRYQGGNNAGHTVVNALGTFKLHLVPSGVFSEGVLSVIGPGVFIDPLAFRDEVAELERRGVRAKGLKVSERAQVCFPFHVDEDTFEEMRLGDKAYGSTRRGIAPCAGDRFLKKGILVGDLYDSSITDRVSELLSEKTAVMRCRYGRPPSLDAGAIKQWCVESAEALAPYVCDTGPLLRAILASNEVILAEAQLGALRDVYYGVYPYSSSSVCLSGFAGIGAGLPDVVPRWITGVMKAYSTCVGAGPFVTEMAPAEADRLRETAREYGAATGRPRRIGHFDAVASRYGARIQGAHEIALTKLDSLSGRDVLKICTAYSINGTHTAEFPLTPYLYRAAPVYEECEGWREDISKCRDFDHLPRAAQRYVERLQALVEKPIRLVSVGAERDALVIRQSCRQW